MNASFSSLLALLCAVSTFVFASDLRAAPGDVDPTFNPNANNTVYSTVTQPDGKILVGGAFTTLQPNGAASSTTRNRLARLNPDGSLDTAFNPNANANVYAVTLQADGKILIGGNFTTLQPNGAASSTTRNYLARLNTDGSLDTTFNPNANGVVYGLAVQTDGRIVVGGAFTTLQPNGAVSATTRNRLARLNTDGSLDTVFNPNANYSIYAVALQADGKVLVGGDLTSLQPNGAASATSRAYIARLTSAGALDSTFNAFTDGSVNSLVVQTDGKIVIGGYFFSFQSGSYSRRGLTRLNTDGSLDATFTTYANNYVYDVAEQADGRILVGGLFTALQLVGSSNTVPRNYLARLNNDAALQKVLVTGQSGSTGNVQLLRSGALPETQFVTFETSTDSGVTWTNLTVAARNAGGWQVSGYNLGGAAGLIRARVRVSNGTSNGSGGLLEIIAPFPTPDISVEQPANTALISGYSTVDYGTLPLSQITPKTFVVRNNGTGALNLGSVTVDGANGGDFTVSTSATSASVASGNSTTFTVSFAPVSTTVSGYRSATLHVNSNANGTNAPFNITLTVLGLSTTTSYSSDGLNDYAKYQLAALGFDWTQSQPALVQTLYGGANSAGLYTTAQVQTLYVGTPLIQRDASSGQFKLTIAVQQSADLQMYTPLSLSTGATTINSAGALEFRFNGSGSAQFYRLQSQ